MPGGRQKRLDLPAPQEGSRRFFYLLWTYIWKLVWLNVVFLIFCVPVITIPAAISAMDRALIVLVRDGNVLLWEEFRDEFRRDFRASLPLGLIFGALLFLSYYLLSLALGNLTNMLGPVAFALGLLVLFFALGRGSYAFLLRAMFDLTTGEILKNANAMAAVRGGRGLAAVLLNLCGLFLVYAFFPYSLIAVALIGVSLHHFLLCYLLNAPIQERIIGPWEELQVQKEQQK